MKSLGVVVSLLNVASAVSPHIRPYEVLPMVPNATRIQSRIYGGTEAQEGQFPFMIFAMMNLRKSGVVHCSSSLITSEWVLLAAHCLVFPSLRPADVLLIGQKADLWDYVNQRISETDFYAPIQEAYWGVQERRAKKFFIHPLYSPETMEHDVALIRASSPFLLGQVQTIPVSLGKITALKICTVLGWGLTRENVNTYKLHYVEKKKVSTTKIGCGYKEEGPFICLEQDGTGICKGDSGSPLVCDGEVWGVGSHYVSEYGKESCGDSLEEYYSELYEDLDWLKSIYDGGSIAGASLKTLLLCLAVLWLSAKR